jgi:hypothetical protein
VATERAHDMARYDLRADVSPRCLAAAATTNCAGVRGWDKNLPGRLLGALPTRPWVKPCRAGGKHFWPAGGSTSRTTVRPSAVGGRGRGSAMTALSKKYGPHLGLVGTW